MKCVLCKLIGIVVYNYFEIAYRFWLLLIYFCICSWTTEEVIQRNQIRTFGRPAEVEAIRNNSSIKFALKKIEDFIGRMCPCPILLKPKGFFPIFFGMTWVSSISRYDFAVTFSLNQQIGKFEGKFIGRVILNRLYFSQPAKSPDIITLDYFFLGPADAKVNKEKPKTICSLKIVVDGLCQSNTKDTSG